MRGVVNDPRVPFKREDEEWIKAQSNNSTKIPQKEIYKIILDSYFNISKLPNLVIA